MTTHAIFFQHGSIEPEPPLARVRELETQLEHCLYLSSLSPSPPANAGLTVETRQYELMGGNFIELPPEELELEIPK